MTPHLPKPRRGSDGLCVSGDKCDHPASTGSKFCDHHRAELARIRASLPAVKWEW